MKSTSLRYEAAAGWRRGWLALLPLAAATACGVVAQDGDDQTALAQGAVLTCSAAAGCKEFTDVTGTIKVQVRTCGWVTSSGPSGSRTAVATCTVDNDAGYVLVGGGAEIENSPIPGAVLKSCIPDPSSFTSSPLWYYTRWLARSSEFGLTNSSAHRLRAYSIGLRLVGMSAAETGANLLWADGTDPNPGVSYTQVVPESNVFLGGGGTVLPYDAPMYLVLSEPSAPTGWTVNAHVNGSGADPFPPKAYAVSINPCPTRADGTVWGCLTSAGPATISSGSGGYISATYTNSDPHFLVTSVGGHGFSFPNTTPKRFLTDIIPGLSTQGTTIWSKNTNVVAAGGSYASVMAVSR
jgi:hypothetical protein